MNVMSAWEQGVTGRRVVVTILDDGIEKDHPDLMDNYVRTERERERVIILDSGMKKRRAKKCP